MDPMLLAVIVLVTVALFFDYINGFHDAANSIATVVSTRVLSPGKAVARLFNEERDAVRVMKWKEIFDYLEDAVDRCEDVANVLEGVVVKHA